MYMPLDRREQKLQSNAATGHTSCQLCVLGVMSNSMLAHLLRLDSTAAAEKHAKMALVPRKAVTRMPGCVARTILTSGPKVAPWKRAQPANNPYLLGIGFRVWESVQCQTATLECNMR